MNSNSPDDWQELFDSLPVDSTVDEKQSQNLKQQVLQACDDSAESSQWKNRLSKTGHYLMTNKTTRWAATAAALLLAGWFLMSTGDRPASAMEAVMQNILNARTVRFDVTGRIGKKDRTPQPVFKFFFAEPGKMRMETDRGNVTIHDSVLGKMIWLIPERKIAWVRTGDDADTPFRESTFRIIREQILTAQKRPDAHVESLGENVIDGRTLIGFRFRKPLTPMTIWADPKPGYRT